jgi:putative hydrolase of the HAD superfamily
MIRQTHTEDETVEIVISFDGDGHVAREEFLGNLMSTWPGIFPDPVSALRHYDDVYPRMNIIDAPTKQMLQVFQQQNVPVGIVTNGETYRQMKKVRHNNLESLVKAVVVSEAVGIRKPDKGIFEHALQLVGADPLRTLFVGDNPEADILGAKSLGMAAAWIHRNRDWPYEHMRPDYILGHVSEVKDLLFG